MANCFSDCADCQCCRLTVTEWPCKGCYTHGCALHWRQLDETLVTRLIAERHEDKLLRIEHGETVLECKRCGKSELPLVAYLDRAKTAHYAAAYCGYCLDTAVHLKYLPVPDGKRRRATMSAGLRYKILLRDGLRCQVCRRTGEQLELGEWLQVDHIVPESRGGATQPENLRCVCSTCNIGKSDRIA